MLDSEEDLILQKVSDALQSKLALGHFSQFYEKPVLTKLAEEEAINVLAKITMKEKGTALITNLAPHIQGLIEKLKFKNKKNKHESDLFVQEQMDFLLRDFKTSVEIKLAQPQGVQQEELGTFLENRKIALLSVFDILIKPGEARIYAEMKTILENTLELEKKNALEKQEQRKALEDAKAILLEMTRQLRSVASNPKHDHDLVKEMLEEINQYLLGKGSVLEQFNPNIYSGMLGTTAEVRKCLDEKEYVVATAKEYVGTLEQDLQTLFDLAEGNKAKGEDSSDLELIRSNDERTAEMSESGPGSNKQNEPTSMEMETDQEQQKEAVIDTVDGFPVGHLFSAKLGLAGSDKPTYFKSAQDLLQFYNSHGEVKNFVKVEEKSGKFHHVAYPDNPKGGRFYCATCEKQAKGSGKCGFRTNGFADRRALWHHLNNRLNAYTCMFDLTCQYKVATLRACIAHIRKVHMKIEITCRTCKQTFCSYDRFQRHFREKNKKSSEQNGRQSSATRPEKLSERI